jgi:hypothetical protein
MEWNQGLIQCIFDIASMHATHSSHITALRFPNSTRFMSGKAPAAGKRDQNEDKHWRVSALPLTVREAGAGNLEPLTYLEMRPKSTRWLWAGHCP